MIGIGDFDKVNRRGKKTRDTQVLFDGCLYSKNKSSGYYVCTSGARRRLHDVLWEHTHGVAVPPGHVIHHLDWNKDNNNINNLVCVTVEEHNLIHNKIGGEAGKKLGYDLAELRNKNI